MAEPELSTADLDLLKKVQALKVADNDDNLAVLDLGPDGEADVSAAIQRLYADGLVWPPHDTRGWRLTQRGEDIVKGAYPS